MARRDDTVDTSVLPAIDWDKQPIGKVSDGEIAERLSVSSVTVRRARTDRGIPAFRVGYREFNWAEHRDLLGTMSDRELAERIGVHTSTVRNKRLEVGQPAFGKNGGPKQKIDWDAQPLGQVTDQEIGDRLGVTSSAVRYERKKRGIKSCAEQHEWTWRRATTKAWATRDKNGTRTTSRRLGA